MISDPNHFSMQNTFYEPANLFVTEDNEMFLSDHSDFSALCSLLYGSQDDNQTYFEGERKFLRKAHPFKNDMIKTYVDDLLKDRYFEFSKRMGMSAQF